MLSTSNLLSLFHKRHSFSFLWRFSVYLSYTCVYKYFGHLMQTADSLEKNLMLGKVEGRSRSGQQGMRWLDGHELGQTPWDGKGQRGLAGCSTWGHKESDTTWWLNNNKCVLSRFSCVRLFATLWTIAHHAPLSVGLSRQEYWSGLPCPPPGDLPNLGTEPTSLMSLHWQAGSLPLAPQCSVYMSIPIHPTSPLPTWCSYVCFPHLCLYFCFANSLICTIFLDSTYTC